MKKIALNAAFAAVAALALSACGSSDKASEEASAENVEMPAEEAVSGIGETPVADASATATEAASDAASDASVAAPAAASSGAEAATSAAEKKM